MSVLGDYNITITLESMYTLDNFYWALTVLRGQLEPSRKDIRYLVLCYYGQAFKDHVKLVTN